MVMGYALSDLVQLKLLCGRRCFFLYQNTASKWKRSSVDVAWSSTSADVHEKPGLIVYLKIQRMVGFPKWCCNMICCGLIACLCPLRLFVAQKSSFLLSVSAHFISFSFQQLAWILMDLTLDLIKPPARQNQTVDINIWGHLRERRVS